MTRRNIILYETVIPLGDVYFTKFWNFLLLPINWPLHIWCLSFLFFLFVLNNLLGILRHLFLSRRLLEWSFFLIGERHDDLSATTTHCCSEGNRPAPSRILPNSRSSGYISGFQRPFFVQEYKEDMGTTPIPRCNFPSCIHVEQHRTYPWLHQLDLQILSSFRERLRRICNWFSNG